MKKLIGIILLIYTFTIRVNAQCNINDSLVFQFIHNNHAYHVIKSKMNWMDAALCAKDRGGYLAEINSLEEQSAINLFVGNAGIQLSQTTAADGGGASYLWIGGNDKDSEGVWNWNGDNDTLFIPFWQGKFPGGSAINGRYTNWGNEPDDFGGMQDGLGLALTNWPLGTAGQWNDLNLTNTLYYLVEYNTLASIPELESGDWDIYPNPTSEKLNIVCNKTLQGDIAIKIYNLTGELVHQTLTSQLSTELSLHKIPSGLYFIQITNQERIVQNSKVVIAR